MKNLILAAFLMTTSATAFSQTQLVIECKNPEPISDGDAIVRFFYDHATQGYQATYWQQTFAGPRNFALNVCTSTKTPKVYTDGQTTLTCHDVNWVNSYTVQVKTGGLVGIGSAKILYRDRAGKTSIISELPCRYVRM